MTSTAGIDYSQGNYMRDWLDLWLTYGDKEALVSTDGRRFTYAQMRERVIDTAAWLWNFGIRPGQTIVMLASNPAESFFTQLGAHLMGCRVAHVSRTSPKSFSLALFDQVSADAFVYEVKVSAELGAELAAAKAPLPVFCIGQGGVGPDVTDPPHVDALPFDPDTITDEPKAIFQTSGTTGASKLVCNGQRFFREVGKVEDFYSPPDGRPIRHLLVAGIWHSASQSALVMAWTNGGTVVVNFGFNLDAFLHTLATEHITSTVITPTSLYNLLDDPRLAELDLSEMCQFTVSTGPAAPARLQQAAQYFGKSLNVVYGMSELVIMAAMPAVGQDPAHPERIKSCGLPYRGTDIEIRDEDGKVLSHGEVGDIWARSNLTHEGYFDNPELTAKTLVDGWLYTGDAGRLDEDGYVYIFDRVAEMINHGGDKVYSRPVEDVLAEHPEVRQAALIGVPDEEYGQKVFAYVVRTPGSTLTAQDLGAYALQRLNTLWAPQEYEFLDAMPVTEYNKVDKKALRARYQQRLRDADRSGAGRS
jgi:fatty-acyl-CoA synthase